VVEGDANPAIDALIALTENNVRERMSVYDVARLLHRVIRATGWTQKEAAERYGLSAGNVSDHLKLLKLKLPKETIRDLAAGRVSAKAVLRQHDSRAGGTAPRARSTRKPTPAAQGGTAQEWAGLGHPDSATGIYLSVHADTEPPLDNLIETVKRWLHLLKKQAEVAARAGRREGTS
jgi:hypothetical protein